MMITLSAKKLFSSLVGPQKHKFANNLIYKQNNQKYSHNNFGLVLEPLPYPGLPLSPDILLLLEQQLLLLHLVFIELSIVLEIIHIFGIYLFDGELQVVVGFLVVGWMGS